MNGCSRCIKLSWCCTQRHHRYLRCGMRFVRRHNFAMCTTGYLRATFSSFYRDQRTVLYNHACASTREWHCKCHVLSIKDSLWLNPKLWQYNPFREIPKMFRADKFTGLNISYHVNLIPKQNIFSILQPWCLYIIMLLLHSICYEIYFLKI